MGHSVADGWRRNVGGRGEDRLVTTIAQLLDFERAWPRHSGAKENAIVDKLEIRPARYYQLLSRAAASHQGQAHDAITAHRILRRNRLAT